MAKDAKGVAMKDSHRMLAMIGIAREGALDEKRRAAREAREKEIAQKKEELQKKLAACAEQSKAAAEKVSKLEAESSDAKVGPKELKDKSSTDMNSIADGIESALTEAKDSVKATTDAIAALTSEVEAELKVFLLAETKKLETSVKPLDARITKVSAVGSKIRAEATKKNAQELDKLRTDALEVIGHHQGEKDLTNDEMFKVFTKSDKIEESAFLKFFSSHKMPAKEGEEAVELPKESLKRLFSYLDTDDEGHISKDKFIGLVKKFMKVVKASVITDAKSIKSNILRRLEEGEVVEVISGPTSEGASDVKRMRVKALQDDLEGWVTPVGNAGTVFFEEGGNTYKVVKETILTGAFVIGGASNQKDRKLKVGETVEVREWARKEEVSGLMRMQVRVKSDGQVGWATSIGNTGIKFLEME
jgi:Ca2+-binding EF-hand superfamily protein